MAARGRGDGEEEQAASEDEADAAVGLGSVQEGGAAEMHDPAAVQVLPLAPDQVRGLDYGYGFGGATMQTQRFVQPQYTDRRIMQKTLLTGLPVIRANAVCQNVCGLKKDCKKKATPGEAMVGNHGAWLKGLLRGRAAWTVFALVPYPVGSTEAHSICKCADGVVQD